MLLPITLGSHTKPTNVHCSQSYAASTSHHPSHRHDWCQRSNQAEGTHNSLCLMFYNNNFKALINTNSKISWFPSKSHGYRPSPLAVLHRIPSSRFRNTATSHCRLHQKNKTKLNQQHTKSKTLRSTTNQPTPGAIPCRTPLICIQTQPKRPNTPKSSPSIRDPYEIPLANVDWSSRKSKRTETGQWVTNEGRYLLV